MKNLTMALAATLLLSGTIISSCSSPDKKVEDAKENVQEAKEDLKDARTEAASDAIKTSNAEEWKAFKESADQKITKVENRIAELKQKMKATGNKMYGITDRRIDTLEMQNKELRQRIVNYEKNQSDWESFKSGYNHDIDAIDNALANFKFNSTK